MKLTEPSTCLVDVDQGLMGDATGRYIKTVGDLAGLYADSGAFSTLQPNDIAYEVTEFRPPGGEGDLIFGVTRMAPGRVGDEFFLTRGHIHARADRPEIYYGQKGHGLMLMESPDGVTRTAEIGPQTICYVPPYWIHRSINLGNEDYVMMFSYPADAGQDYGIIERSGGMRVRIVDDGRGGWRSIDNPNYRARSAADAAGIVGLSSLAQSNTS
ncbi:MAG: glucose-6-phosphate isomerase [Hyphomicrobiales bacterium]|nr:glucose-6-phosphate isomerase [Hyphomicrobiales bacterium]